jgi:signal transduction histidine kinase
MPKIQNDNLKFSTAILSRLGEELNPHPDQGIIELIRNSYDADARKCTVKLINTNKQNGSIQIIDDGVGMDLGAISKGWLVLGRSEKKGKKRTALGRIPVGDKGLGRLAALRMGTRVTMITRSKKEPLFEHKVIINWGDYEKANVVEDVSLEIESYGSTKIKKPGTEIYLEKLKTKLTKSDVERLSRAMILLGDPFDNSLGFKAVLDCPEYKDLRSVILNDYFSSAEYYLSGKINNEGFASAVVKDFYGKTLWKASHVDIRGKDKPYNAPVTDFELWAFNISKTNFLPDSIKLSDIREWLKTLGGVHFYYRGLRVSPYGDKGHDWLDLNLRRSQNPELRPSTNTSIGKISTDDSGNNLGQKTDRTGFIENEVFDDIKQFAQHCLEWMASKRLADREEKRQKVRKQSMSETSTLKTTLSTELKKLPLPSKESLESIINKYNEANKKQISTLKEELQLYRTLSTVGTTFTLFSHELKNPLSRIKMVTNSIGEYISKRLEEKDLQFFKKPLEIIQRAISALTALPKFAMGLLEKDKREMKVINVHSEIDEILQMLESFLQEAKVTTLKEFVNDPAFMYSSKASFQAIFVNLITNSLNAFIHSGIKNEKRTILFRTYISSGKIQVHLLDNGPGIRGLAVDEIWLPGKSTIPNGTGLGLTIVKDTVLDLGGEVYALANGELGGAEFILEFPIVKEEPE